MTEFTQYLLQENPFLGLTLIALLILISIHSYYISHLYHLRKFMTTILKNYSTYPMSTEFYLNGHKKLKANVTLRGYGAIVVEYDADDERLEAVYIDDNNVEQFYRHVVFINNMYKRLYFNSVKK